MPISQVSVSTTSASLVSGSTATQGSSSGLVIKNIGTEIVWLGSSSGVSASNGFPLDPRESVTVDEEYVFGLNIYAVTEVGTSTVAVLQP